MPPEPRASRISYLPTVRGMAKRLLLLHAYLEAAPQAMERHAELRNLILTLAREGGRIHVAEADLVGDSGQLAHRLHHQRGQQDIHGDEQEQEQPYQQEHEAAQRSVRALHWQIVGHADNLRADDIVELPAKAVR